MELAAVDAQFYWMSAKVPSDQFLLYAFDGVPGDVDATLAALRTRAASCSEFSIRVDDTRSWRYPKWVAAPPTSTATRHHPGDLSWTDCLAAVAQLADTQLDCAVRPWRLHVFAPVHEVPTCAGPSTVAVLQVAHALADGTRAAALAAWLFGRSGPPPEPPMPLLHRCFRSSYDAATAQRRLAEDTAQALVPPPGPSRTLRRTNDPPRGPRVVRTVVRRRAELPGPTVTVAALAAVGAALRGHLGLDDADLGAEVPMAKSGTPLARNHFRNVGVGLYPHLAWDQRTDAIAADLAARRRRAQHPAARADELAFAAVPAVLLRWGVGRFDPEARSATVAGNTVVSSVNRGAADLRFGSAPVVLTAGYPALSPMMGLVHGVHGIGDTVAISVHAAQSAVGDVDAYVAALAAALDGRG